jgi:hypothetical protein
MKEWQGKHLREWQGKHGKGHGDKHSKTNTGRDMAMGMAKQTWQRTWQGKCSKGHSKANMGRIAATDIA